MYTYPDMIVLSHISIPAAILMCFCAIVVPEQMLGFIILTIACAFCPFIIKFSKYSNFILISEKSVEWGQEKHGWEECYITIFESRGKYGSTKYYVAFGSRYLSEEEMYELEKSKGFYVFLSADKARYILSYYDKKVQISQNSGLNDCRAIPKIIKKHNENHK